jgi:predicted ribosome quality control (RQC) complex YloA/Tae2 family protein
MAVPGPKSELTAMDMLVLSDEMHQLAGSYVEKVFQPTPESLVLRLRKPGAGRTELVVEHGRWLYMRAKEPGEGATSAPPPPFAMLLRKHLEGRRLTAIEQRGFERILVIAFDEYGLIIELFREGNVILTLEGTIVKPLRNQKWEHREVRSGETYSFPPTRLDPRGLEPEEFERLLRASKSDLVRTLAVAINLGGRYAEEACARAGLERNLKIPAITQEAARKLHGIIEGLFAELRESRKPVLVLKEGVPLDFAPFPHKLHEGLDVQTFPSLNAAAEAYADYWRDRELFEVRSDRLSDEIEKLRRQSENQEVAARGFLDGAASDRRIADAITCAVDDIAAVLKETNYLRESGGWDAVSKAASGGKLSGVAEVRPHEGKLIMKFKDPAGELSVPLDVRKNARENATAYYRSSKEAEEKARRTTKLIEETNARIAKLEHDGPIQLQAQAEAGKHPSRKVRWFEKYRWFLSSDGIVVIGGRDATTNDRIVKRHLKEGDAYVHADVHGAPSVVVKKGNGQIPERTLKEACEFSFAYSKAWGSGGASGSSYWVNPDQVSKTPESGEFLPKGGFVVRGKKNFYHDILPRLAIGWIEHEGDRLLMGGPESALGARSEKFVMVQPGGNKRDETAKSAAKELGTAVDDVLRLLPAGNCHTVP